MEISRLLDTAKEHSNITSDRALAARLKVSHAVPHQWRTGFSKPTAEHAQRLAELAGLDPAPIVAAVMIDATKDAGLKRTLERFKRAVAAAFLAAALLPSTGWTFNHGIHYAHNRPRLRPCMA